MNVCASRARSGAKWPPAARQSTLPATADGRALHDLDQFSPAPCYQDESSSKQSRRRAPVCARECFLRGNQRGNGQRQGSRDSQGRHRRCQDYRCGRRRARRAGGRQGARQRSDHDRCECGDAGRTRGWHDARSRSRFAHRARCRVAERRRRGTSSRAGRGGTAGGDRRWRGSIAGGGGDCCRRARCGRVGQRRRP